MIERDTLDADVYGCYDGNTFTLKATKGDWSFFALNTCLEEYSCFCFWTSEGPKIHAFKLPKEFME